MSKGVELIAQERQRQVEVEGWTPEHDDEHADGALAEAAACYAIAENRRRLGGFPPFERRGVPPAMWPWASDWWKPTPADPIRELQRAGALIAAEIDRLLRAQERQP